MARVPYVTRNDLSEGQRAIYDEIAGLRNTTVLGNGFHALLNSPEAAQQVSALGAYLRFRSVLPALLRELTILAVASELACEYEWRYHAPLASRSGASEEVIAAIQAGRVPEGLAPGETAAVRYAQELLRNRRVAPETFAAAQSALGNSGVVELTLAVGYYSMLALAFHALEVEPDEG